MTSGKSALVCKPALTSLFGDSDNKLKLQKGHVLLTTHRVLFYLGTRCLEVPLHNVAGFEKLGGLFQTSGVQINLCRQGSHSPHVVDFYQNILRRDPPQPPRLPNAVSLRFHDKTRDRFFELV